MPSALPAELLHRIIVLSLPVEVSFAALRERYRSLLSHALVCKEWTPWAQLELFRHVVLSCDNHRDRFLSALDSADNFGGHVKSLRVEGDGSSEFLKRLDELLRGCWNVEDLRLSWTKVSLEGMKFPPKLHTLHLHEVYLEAEFRSIIPPLQHLQGLSVVDTGPLDHVADLLGISTSPVLKSLSVAVPDNSELLTIASTIGFGPTLFAEKLRSRGPHLEHLTLRDPCDHFTSLLKDTWPKLVSLKSFSMQNVFPPAPAQVRFSFILPAMPTAPLQRLRLTATSGEERDTGHCSAQELETDLAAVLSHLSTNSIPALQRLSIPDDFEVCESCLEAYDDDKFDQKLEEAVEVRGIALQKDSPESKAFENWETFLDPW